MLMHVIGSISVVLLFEWMRLKDEYTSQPNPKALTVLQTEALERGTEIDPHLML